MNVSKSRLARPIVAIVAIALTIGAWSGLAATAQDSPSGKIIVHVWGGPPDIESLEAAIADFAALNPNIEVEVQAPIPACGVDFAQCKINLAGGAMPDVFVPGIWTYNAMVDTDALLEDLTPLMERDGVPGPQFSLKGKLVVVEPAGQVRAHDLPAIPTVRAPEDFVRRKVERPGIMTRDENR